MIEEKGCVSRVKKLYGTYRFRVEGFSGLPNRVGESVESPEFSLCGHIWQLRIFPGGSLEQHKGFLSFYLASKSNKIARANYKLSIVNQIIGGEDETFSSAAIRIFEPKGDQVDGWGRDRFVVADMLNDADFGLCVNDAVIFKVDITVHGDLEPVLYGDDDSKSGFVNYCLEGSLHAIFDDEKTADLVIVIKEGDCQDIEKQERKEAESNEMSLGGLELLDVMKLGRNIELEDWKFPSFRSISSIKSIHMIHAHRCILAARSPVFKAMFSSAMKESVNGEVVIEDFDYEVVKSMVYYMYTDTFPDKKAMTGLCVPLLKAAKKYEIVGLCDYCELYIGQQLQITNVLNYLEFADMIGAKILKQKCLLYVAQYSHRITQLQELFEVDKDLLEEINHAIDAFNRRKGCRKAFERKGKYQVTCVIM